jgi:hypothetical protein
MRMNVQKTRNTWPGKKFKITYFAFLALIFLLHEVVQEEYKYVLFPLALCASVAILIYHYYTLVKPTEETRPLSGVQRLKPLLEPVLSMGAIALLLFLFWYFIP